MKLARRRSWKVNSFSATSWLDLGLLISKSCVQRSWSTNGTAELPMNIHHLELFYYVARHGGITEAVRNIPYGIQQPAVSGQVAQLEEYLGVVLFQRRPFALTPAGQKLYAYIQPFFSNLDQIASEL